ncbi:MAG: caspase family protein [Bacteroidota bacterium]
MKKFVVTLFSCCLVSLTVLGQDCKDLLSSAHDLYNKDNFTRAIAAYDKAIDCDMLQKSAHYWRARALYKEKRYAEARTGFTKALEMGYDREDALLQRGYANWMEKDYEKAVEDLAIVGRIGGDNASSAYYWSGRSYYELKKYEESRYNFTQALILGYDDKPSAYLYRGFSNWMNKDYEDAVQDLTEVINIGEDDLVDAYFWRGRTKYELDQFSSAKSDFNVALQKGYNESTALLWRGYSSWMIEDYQATVRDLDKVKRFNDDNYEYAKKWSDKAKQKLAMFSETSTASTNNYDYSSTDKPKVYAVIVGVARYNHINSLNYTDDDAYKLAMFMKSPEGGAIPDERMSLLIDEDATKANILSAMKRTFSKARQNDVIFFYFSGHGKDGAFLPIDYDGYNNALAHADISSIFKSSPAKHKIAIADACHSGSLDRSERDAGVANVLETYYDAWENSYGGMALMMSSKASETSIEFRGIRQGVFSHYLIRGMKGEADKDANKVVTIKELYGFVNEQVRKYTNYHQNPVINGSFDPNMPVAVVK